MAVPSRDYRQCFICRQWSWDVTRHASQMREMNLCLPCYVDVLEVRQTRGVMAEPTDAMADSNGPSSGEANTAGHSPSSLRQLEMFDEC